MRKKAELLLRWGGIIVLYERNSGISDNPTLKQKYNNIPKSELHDPLSGRTVGNQWYLVTEVWTLVCSHGP